MFVVTICEHFKSYRLEMVPVVKWILLTGENLWWCPLSDIGYCLVVKLAIAGDTFIIAMYMRWWLPQRAGGDRLQLVLMTQPVQCGADGDGGAQ